MNDRRGFLKSLMAGTAIAGIPAVKEVSAMSVTPQDIVVLKCSGRVSAEAIERINKNWKENFPDVKAVVVSEGWDIEIIKRGYAEIPKSKAMSTL